MSTMEVSSYNLIDVQYSASTWSVFEPVNLNTMFATMSCLKLTICPHVIPSHFLGQVLDTVGPDLFSVVNKCLQTGSVPHDLKLATVNGFGFVRPYFCLWSSQPWYSSITFEACFGVRDMVLLWFRWYLSDCRFVINIGQHSSSDVLFRFGVPQGSIPGLELFSLYLIPLGYIFNKNGVSFHLFYRFHPN